MVNVPENAIRRIAKIKNTEFSPSYHINGKLEKIDLRMANKELLNL